MWCEFTKMREKKLRIDTKIENIIDNIKFIFEEFEFLHIVFNYCVLNKYIYMRLCANSKLKNER